MIVKKSKPGFTLIELLVVIAIIGLLATLSIVSLSGVRSRARDTRRIADVRQIQTALVLYQNSYGQYPESDGELAHIALAGFELGGLGEFMHPIPQAPTPADGECDLDNDYYYWSDGLEYELCYCLGNGISGLQSGAHCATPAYLQMAESECVDAGGSCVEDSDCCSNSCPDGECLLPRL